jgi:hypothetical protein
MMPVHLRRQRSNCIWAGLLYLVRHKARVGNYPGSQVLGHLHHVLLLVLD